MDFKMDAKLVQSDGLFHLNDLRPISLWIFGTVKLEKPCVCENMEMLIVSGIVPSMVEQWTEYI